MKLKSTKHKHNGFTLIELLLAMVIFALIIGGVVLFSVRTIEAHTKSQAMQNAIDNARFAMETLNKRIRTSAITSSTENFDSGLTEITIKDNASGDDFKYEFVGDALEVDDEPLVGDDKIKIKAEGRFFIKLSDEDAASDADKKRGMVTTVIKLTYNEDGAVSESDSVVLQSTVSLRDYGGN